MSLSSILEKVLIGPGAARRRKEIDGEISEGRANLSQSQVKLVENMKQHEQVTSSAERVMQTITHAMIMMEASSGKHKG